MIGEGLQTARDAQRILKKRAQRGASLIEIMVVLVVLLIGIFLAIRIFPVGFGVLRANGNRSIATRMAEQQMGQLRSDVSNLPQGVLFAYPVADTNNGTSPLVVRTQVDPDNLQQVNSDGQYEVNGQLVQGSVPFNPYFSDINKFRYIKGERLKVPLPTTMVNGSGSIYVCKFGPLLMDPTVGNPASVPTTATKALFDSYLAVYGAPMARVNVESSGAGFSASGGFFRTLQTYLIDYNEDDGAPALIAFAPLTPAPNRSRTYRITLTYDNGNGLVSDTFPMTVPDAQTGIWLTIKNDTNGQTYGNVVPGSESVAREFNRIGVAGAWDTTDPYQYKLVSPNIATSDADTFGNIGVLLFNPAGGSYAEQTSGNVQPFVAYLDYAVLDWHILREDREVPSTLLAGGNTIPVRLVLNNLKRLGDSETDNTIYNGLYNDPNNKVDIQVFNLNRPNGVPLVAGVYNGGNTPTPANADYYIETDERGGTYRTGTIYLNAARVPAGSKLRILYKAQGDWGMAIQKAYSQYDMARLPNGTAANYPLKGAFDKFGVVGSGATAQMRFPLADLNKAFVVTVQYTLADGTVKRLQPIQMTADGTDEDKTADEMTFDQKFSVVNLPKFLPGGIVAEFNNATGWSVAACQGVSVKSRVIWRETDSNRWKVQDMDSYLTPKTTEAN